MTEADKSKFDVITSEVFKKHKAHIFKLNDSFEWRYGRIDE
jgi:hypothetical protein